MRKSNQKVAWAPRNNWHLPPRVQKFANAEASSKGKIHCLGYGFNEEISCFSHVFRVLHIDDRALMPVLKRTRHSLHHSHPSSLDPTELRWIKLIRAVLAQSTCYFLVKRLFAAKPAPVLCWSMTLPTLGLILFR